MGIFIPYWPLWLKDVGLNPFEIGWVLACSFWIKVAAQPLIARLADQSGQTRWLTTSLMLLAALGFVFLSNSQGFWIILIVSSFTAACYQPVLPIMESVTLKQINLNHLNYGYIRLWGSIAFISSSLVVGWLLEGSVADRVAFLMAANMILVSISCSLAPNKPARRIELNKNNSVWDLFTPTFFMFLLAAGLIQISHSILYGFATIHWRDQGHSAFSIGCFWAVGVLAEILVFGVAGFFRNRITPIIFLILASLGGIIRWPLMAISDDSFVIMLLQTLHGLTFGAAHLGAMAFLSAIVSEQYSATGQSIYYALVGGILAGCMFPIAGALYTELQGDAFWIMGGISCAALIASFVLLPLWEKRA